MKVPLNGEAALQVRILMFHAFDCCSSCVTSALNFDFEEAFDASDEVLLLFAGHVLLMLALLQLIGTNSSFSFSSALRHPIQLSLYVELSDKLILDVNFNIILIFSKISNNIKFI